MKRFDKGSLFKSTILFLLFINMGCGAQLWAQQVQTSPEGFETFEARMADTTWLMKKYYFCMLERGDNRDTLTADESAKIQAGHLAHLNKLGEDGKICLAGPFENGDDWRGIVVYKVPSLEEAQKLAHEDPAVIAGRLKVRIVPWWAAVGSKLD